MELQVTQEYTGQQRHLVYLAPMWKQVLDFDLRAGGQSTPAKEIIAGKSFHRPLGGMVAVAGVGRDAWLGSPLALANLYAFGRLAWNPDLTPEEIAAEWTRQTISTDPEVVQTRGKNADAILAGLRELHRPAGLADADRHHRLALRAEYRVQRKQRLGPVAPRRRRKA